MIQSWPKFLDRGQARLSFKDSVSVVDIVTACSPTTAGGRRHPG